MASLTVLALTLIEGGSSLLVALHETLAAVPSYQRYDSALGWVGQRNLESPDFFGPGKGLRINSQGFREDHDTPMDAPQGTPRVVCTGDSFTFGDGIGNDATWCHLLEPRVSSINLGQSGYGVDQAYLRYLRDGYDLEHTIHIFAFIFRDLDRMGTPVFLDSGKPVLRLEAGQLVPTNVPVPWFRHWLARKAAHLRAVRLGRFLLRRPLATQQAADPPVADPEIAPVARRVFESLREANSRKGRATLFVYLPTLTDLHTDCEWRSWTGEVMNAMHAEFLDLTLALRELPSGQVARFFIDDGPHRGHYTEQGNRWVAKVLGRQLLAIRAPDGSLRVPNR